MARRSRSVRRVPRVHHWLFWDVEPRALDVDRHARYILARILEFGGIAQVRWALRVYGKRRIHRFFREEGHPELSDRTRRFWRIVFRAAEETWVEPPAFRRSSAAPWAA